MNRSYLKVNSVAVVRLLLAGSLLVFLGTMTVSADGETADPVVLSLGETKLTVAQVQKFLDALPPQFRPFYSGVGKPKLAELLVNTELLVREANKRHLADRPDVKLQTKIATDSILSNAAKLELQKEMKVTDAELQQYLENHRTKFEEARARRIVIRSKSSVPWDQSKSVEQLPDDKDARIKADALRKQLSEGADFEELAAKHSDDSLTAGKGGDLGFNRRGSQAHLIVPPLEEKIFSLAVGSTSDVMQTALGYEIVKLEEKRLPKVSDIRKELEQSLLNQKTDDLLKVLKSRETIFVDEKFFNLGVSPAPAGN